MDVGAAPLRVLELLEHHHGCSFAEHEAVPLVVKRPTGPRRLVIAGGERGQQIEAGDSKGMDHAVGAAGQHHIGLATAHDLSSLANRLARSRTGREAVEVWPLGIEQASKMPGRHVGLLLDFCKRMERLQSLFRELGHVEHVAGDRRVHHPREGVEVLLPFAAAQVDAQPGWVCRKPLQQTRILHGLERRSRCEFCVPTAEPPARGVLPLVADVPVADLGRDLGREPRGVKHRCHADARSARHQVFPQRLHAQAQRRDAAYARDHHPAPAGHHRRPPPTTGVCRDHHSGRTSRFPASSRPMS